MLTNMINLSNFNILDMKESEYDYRFLVKLSLYLLHIVQNVVPLQTYINMVRKNSYFLTCQCTQNVWVFMSIANDINVGNVMKHFLNICQIWTSTVLLLMGYFIRLEASLEKTFSMLQMRLALIEKTLRNIFNDYVDQLEAQTDFKTSKWLDIDEVHLLQNYGLS